MKENQFYVYEHRTLDTGRIFYIGKGHGYRATSRNGRNTYWRNIVAKHGYSVRFVEKNISEASALDLEMAVIDFYKWAGVKLANITDGGEGTAGCVWTPERREKMNAAINGGNFKETIATFAKQRWADPEYKKRVSAAIQAASTTPEASILLSARSVKNWSNPEYVAKNVQARLDSWQSEERKKAASETIANTWKDDSIRAKRIEGIKANLVTEEARKKTASSMHTPEAKANNRAAIAKAFAEDPEKRKRQQEASQAAFKRPEVIAKKAASMAAYHAKRRQWIVENDYKGSLQSVTKKMMESI